MTDKYKYMCTALTTFYRVDGNKNKNELENL